MENDDVFEPGTERRLRAVLTFSETGAELLVHNGTARAETVWIETVIAHPARRTRSARYDLEPGERLPLLFPLFEDEDPGAVTVRVRSRERMLVLRRDATEPVQHKTLTRLGSAVVAAALLIFVAHASLAPGALTPIASLPVTSTNDLPVVPVSAATRVAKPALILPPLVRADPMRRAAAPVVVALAPRPAVPARFPLRVPERRPARPQPKITALHAPLVATSGQGIPISYRAVGSTIRIVASIGPTVVARRSISGPSGTVTIAAPPSHLDGRVMTVRAYATSGGRTATGETVVVLDRSE